MRRKLEDYYNRKDGERINTLTDEMPGRDKNMDETFDNR
jgi:hypothetical protein